MPSVNSSSVPNVFDSSTVTTPSLPTLSIASAMTSPIELSAADTVATAAMSDLSSTSLACDWIDSTAAATAASMPRLRPSGLAPAATFFMPRLTIVWASTVAVVVPSPATSLVLVATSLTSWAPMFSNGSSSSTSLAMDTPSLVIVGRAELLVEHDVAALRAERHLDGVGELVDAGLEGATRFVVEFQDLCHVFLTVSGVSGHFSTIASTSRAERTSSSSPSTVTSVPPYFE